MRQSQDPIASANGLIPPRAMLINAPGAGMSHRLDRGGHHQGAIQADPIVIAQPPTAPFIAINARPPRPAANAAKT